MSRKKPRKPEPRHEQSFSKRKPQQSSPPPPRADLLPLAPKTAGQEELIDAIQRNEITICDGPAGTGKTLISFGSALHYRLSDKNIKRIVICRPTIAAGDDDDIGYLPGDLNEKMGPFIAPFVRDSAPLLIDTDMHLNPQDYKQFVENFLMSLDIEIVPLMFMRGRTFNNSFVILDEAQNCTKNDFKLFLTRIGKNSKVVIEGDSTQADRDNGYLTELQKDLAYMNKVAIVKLDGKDIVRNPLIAEILKRID